MAAMDPLEPRRVGLCFDCRYHRLVAGGRSTFYMCQRSFTQPEFPKYPRLPVIACVGYDPASAPAGSDGTGHSGKLTR
jgi:hypothetical protein